MDELGQRDLAACLEHFWHPVATVAELPADRPLAVRLLGRDLAVARLADGSLAAVVDRCAHRSTRLSIGTVEGCELRCAYHGWSWDAGGQCTSIPSMPDGPIPTHARIAAYEVRERYGLVWVCLGDADVAPLPPCSAIPHPRLRVIDGEPYTWGVSALRRVENFVDLAHFAWVHDGTLGNRSDAVPPVPEIDVDGCELRFRYDPPEFDPASEAMYGTSTYRLAVPGTVDIVFELASGATRVLWMTASPLDERTCRVFWKMGRSDELDDDDQPHIDFQRVVLDEDEPVVCGQNPPEFPLDPAAEVSVSTDRVSNVYRRTVRGLVRAQRSGGADALRDAVISARSAAASESSSHDESTASAAMSYSSSSP